VFRKLPDGSRLAVAVYFTLEEAQARAKALEENSQDQGRYFVLDLLAQKIIPLPEVKPPTAPPKPPTPQTRSKN
jgi:hypothetical protein